jgi:predicted ATPase
LFVVETLRALHDAGMLYRDANGAWSTPWDETTVDYAELPLPVSVREGIVRRLTRLEPTVRTTLNAAAVLGADFDFRLLIQVADLDQETGLMAVNELVRRQFLEEGPMAYRFSHDRVRQVIYAEMPEAERRHLHRRAGEALEALQPGQVEALAHHFGCGGGRDKALAYTLQAGEHAQALYDYRMALAHYQQALTLVGADPAARWDVLARQDQMLDIIGLPSDRNQVLAEMLRLAETLNDMERRARTRHRQGELEMLAGDPRRALTVLDDAVEMARAAGARGLVGQCLIAASRAHWRMGDLLRCQAAIEEARSLFRETGDWEGESRALNMLGNLHLGLTGDYSRGLAHSMNAGASTANGAIATRR